MSSPFFFCIPSCSEFTILLLHSQLQWVHHSSSAFPAVVSSPFFFCIPSCSEFTILLLRSKLYWGSPFFFYVLSYTGVHHSSSVFPAVVSSPFFFCVPSCSEFTILLRSQLYWGSPFFFCVPSYTGVHHSSSSTFPAISLGFAILLLLLRSQLYLWNSPFFTFFSVPSYISGLDHFGWDFCVCDHFIKKILP